MNTVKPHLYFNWILLLTVMIFKFVLTTVYEQYPEHVPYSLSEYKSHGGVDIDYYCGYVFLTSPVKTNQKEHANIEPRVVGKSIWRYIYFFFWAMFWLFGLSRWYYIKGYYEEMQKQPYQRQRRKWRTPSGVDYFWGWFTTGVSIYGMIYSFKYIKHFWLS